jgi:hypothetical protein
VPGTAARPKSTKKSWANPDIATWGILTVSIGALAVAAVALAVTVITYELIKNGNETASHAADVASLPYLTLDPKGFGKSKYPVPGRVMPPREAMDVAVVGRRAFFAADLINHGPGVAAVVGFRVYPAGDLQLSWGAHYPLVRPTPSTGKQKYWTFTVGDGGVLNKVTTLTAAEARYLQRWLSSGGAVKADIWYENDPYVPDHKFTDVITYVRQSDGTGFAAGDTTVDGTWRNEYPDMECDGCTLTLTNPIP